MNILTPFLRQAAQNRSAPALILGEHTVTYGALAAYSGAAAYWLQQAGVKRGDRVAVFGAGTFEHLVTAFGLVWLGATHVDVPGPPGAETLASMVKKLGVSAFVACERGGLSRADFDTPAVAGLPVLAFTDIYKPMPEKAEVAEPARDVIDSLWRIGFSSGTTGEPKAIGWSHRAANVVALQIKSQYPFRAGWRVLLGVRVQVQFAVNYTIAALHSGATVIGVATSEVEALLEQMRRHEPQQLIVASGLAMHIARTIMEKMPGTDRVTPPSLRIVCCGGSVLSAAVQNVIRTRIAPEFYNHYGSSEAGLIARTTPEMQVKAPLLSGLLSQWMEGEAVDENDQPLPYGTIGQLRFRGPGMSSGYLGNEEAHAKHFKDGWFYPGDLGGVTRQGFIALSGREDDRFFFAGMKFHPLPMEKVLNTHPQVIDSAITTGFAGKDPVIVALLVLAEGADLEKLQHELIARCDEHLGVGVGPRAFFAVKSLPTAEGGKLKRDELPRLLESLTARPS
jgi:acyl-coenzyme A synthetase/AMP-(fatty) acid ligase